LRPAQTADLELFFQRGDSTPSLDQREASPIASSVVQSIVDAQRSRSAVRCIG